MADREFNADVFAIPSLWRTSKWHNESEAQTVGPFFTDELKTFDGKSDDASRDKNTILQLSRPEPASDGFFKLPTLDYVNDDTHAEIESALEDDNKTNHESTTDDGNDIWMDLNAPSAKKPRYKTWDGFMKGNDAEHQPSYITEAGPAVYDALLQWQDDPISLQNVGVPMVDAKAYMAALLSMAVGRGSVFFVLSMASKTFEPALSNVRLSGYSSGVLKGLQKQCVSCGEAFLHLRLFIKTTYTRRPSRCSVALAGALDRILNTLQRYLDVDGHDPRSVLELQQTISNIKLVLQPLRGMMLQLKRKCSDEDILSLAFQQACVSEHKESFVREIMREILQIVSVPWIDFLEQWIGTRLEEGIPFTTADVNQSKGFIKVESETCYDDFGQEIEEVDFRLDQSKIPDFFPDDIARMAFETGKNLRFIKSAHPSHVLSRSDIAHLSQPPETKWLYDWQPILELEERVSVYKAGLEAKCAGLQASVLSDQLSGRTGWSQRNQAPGHIFGEDENNIEDMIQTSMAQMAAPLEGQMSSDKLTRIIEKKFLNNRLGEAETLSSTPHPSLMPVLSFGGVIAAQAHCVNRESLRLLFDAHDLRVHLNLQKEFQLLGNGVFCSQLSHALFDPDLETAERRAGVSMDGSVMGLRLGGRVTWPPASSELRLALMGVLTDSYIAEHGFEALETGHLKSQTPSMPGDLSFSVRDLSPEEIEKCMQPDGLEALDFLRLAYATPPELKVIITPLTLIQYDRIFRFLLRMLRLSYVVGQLFRDVNLRTSTWHNPSTVALRFAREARHFVSSVSEYFMGTAIAQPWEGFQQKLDQVEEELKEKVAEKISAAPLSPERVQEQHTQMIEQIMIGLFLRKRQQAVMKLLEEILNIVLKYAKYSRLRALGRSVEDNSPEDLYQGFKKKVQVFITVCRNLTEKSRAKSGQGAGLGDDNMVSQLLLKLDVNNYYVR